MKKFHWENKYSVGNDKIDQQHKKLISLANLVLSLSGSGEDREVIKRAVITLYDYTRNHFADEEAYMEEMNYAALPAHKVAHSNIVGEMNKIMKESKNIHSVVEKFKRLMSAWVLEHIMNEDTRIGKP